MSKGIDLGLESLLAKSTPAKKAVRKNSGYFWVHLATLHNKQVALQVAGEKITRVICTINLVMCCRCTFLLSLL